jgi:membrane fusion protein (multidrug efflux system)
VVAGVERQVLLAPQQGVARTATGDATALVVGEGNKAERRRLTLSRAVGNQWLVTSGLKAGDQLIVEGLQRVRPDQLVRPVPAGSSAAAQGPGAGGQAGQAGQAGQRGSSGPASGAVTVAAPGAAARAAPAASAASR